VAPVSDMEDISLPPVTRQDVRIAELETELKQARLIVTLERDLKHARDGTERAQRSIQDIAETFVKVINDTRGPTSNQSLHLGTAGLKDTKEILCFQTPLKEAVLPGVTEVIKSSAVASRAKPTIKSGQSTAEVEGTHEVQDLRLRLKESLEEINRLKENYRRATHMRAEEVAQNYPEFSYVPGGPGNSCSDASDGVSEPHTLERGPKHFILDPKIQEIDSLNLDDVLGKDDVVYITSKEPSKDVSPEHTDVVIEHIGSMTELVSTFWPLSRNWQTDNA
jgi:hypothetical protein